MNEEDLMFKEAFEYLKPHWEPKDGDIIYFEYSEKDKEFWKKKYEEANKPYEQKDGYWYVDNNVEFKNNGTKRYSEHLKEEAKAWKARVEDFEKILTNSTPGGLLFEFLEWFYLHYENEKKLPDNFSITLIWLCYFMEILNKRQWNREIKKWEALP